MPLNNRLVVIDYTNWRGERRAYRIMPLGLFWGSNEWHPTPQWLVIGREEGRSLRRTYALSNIHSWRGADDVPTREEPKQEEGDVI
jgi:hypothetical protein